MTGWGGDPPWYKGRGGGRCVTTAVTFFSRWGQRPLSIVIHVLAVARLRFVACPGSRATRGPHASAYSWHMPSIGTGRTSTRMSSVFMECIRGLEQHSKLEAPHRPASSTCLRPLLARAKWRERLAKLFELNGSAPISIKAADDLRTVVERQVVARKEPICDLELGGIDASIA